MERHRCRGLDYEDTRDSFSQPRVLGTSSRVVFLETVSVVLVRSLYRNTPLRFMSYEIAVGQVQSHTAKFGSSTLPNSGTGCVGVGFWPIV